MLRWQRWSAVSGALFAVILFAAILLSGNETDSTQSVASWFSDSDHQARSVSAFFLGVAASLAFLAFMATLREMLLDAEGGRTGTLSALVSGPGIAFVALLNASLALFAAPALLARDDNFTLDGDTAMMFQNAAWLIFVAAVMVASVFVLATSMAALRTGVLPSWLGRAGLIVAVLMLFAFFWIPVLIFLAWTLVASLWMMASAWRTATPPTTATEQG